MSKKMSLMLVVLLLVSLVAAACGDDKDKKKVELKQSFESTTGIKLRYPDGWAARDGENEIEIINKTAYFDLEPDSEFPQDAFAVVVLPPMQLDEMNMADAAITDVLNTVVEEIVAHNETLQTSSPVGMKIMGEDAARMAFTNSGNKSEGFFAAVKIDENTVIVAVSMAHDGKLREYNDTALRILESLSYTAPASTEG